MKPDNRIQEKERIFRYRQHNPGYDYKQPGIYHITLVVGHRDALLGHLNMDVRKPGVVLSDIGRLMWEQWEKSPALQARHGNKVRLHSQTVMPNHWHGVIEIEERMSWSIGDMIQAVKAALTSRWRKITGYQEPKVVAERIRNMTHEERKAYYATRPREEQPLFDDDYDDTICLRNADRSYDQRHLSSMVNYVNDNARRAIIIKTHPSFMERRLHIVIDGRNYAAFGNMFLLRWARKVQVFCHRKARVSHLTEEERRQYGYTYATSPDLVTRVPYTDTTAWQREHKEWMRQVMEGQTVIVTPGISQGERLMKNECLEKGIPLIHIQSEPITQYWKPEKERFQACENGSLLILAPWDAKEMGSVCGVPSDTDYSIFHNLNDVAFAIANFTGKALLVN